MTLNATLVHVYRSPRLGDCTNSGLTSKFDSIMLVDPQNDQLGGFTVKDGDRVLLVDHRGGRDHPCLTPRAVPATIINGAVIPDKGWHMFGGNYVSTSDSRFREAFGHVLPVHDRVE